MKFILALSVVALAAVGCGHSNQDRPAAASPTGASAPQVSSTPDAASQMAKANLDVSSSAILGSSTDAANQVPASVALDNAEGVTPVNVGSVATFYDQANTTHKILVLQERALKQAQTARSNTVQLTPELFDLTMYAAGTGALGTLAFRSYKELRARHGSSKEVVVRDGAAAESEVSQAEAAGFLSRWGQNVKAASIEAGPYAGVGIAGPLAAIGLFYTAGKFVNTIHGIGIKLTDDDQITYLKGQVDIARRNAAAAKKNYEYVSARAGDVPANF